MPSVDRAILRLAVWELQNTPTPPKVVIDEAIELSRSFATSDAPAAPQAAEASQPAPVPDEPATTADAEPVAETDSTPPRRAGWWSRRFGGGN